MKVYSSVNYVLHFFKPLKTIYSALCSELVSSEEPISNPTRLTPVHGDNGGFCLINTSFQYNAFFRVTDEQASTTSEGSERE